MYKPTDILSPSAWEAFYDKMPEQCLDVIHGNTIGAIGWNTKIGWFIVNRNELIWSEYLNDN